MADKFDLNTREELRARIGATVASIQDRATDLTAEALAAELEADADALAVRAFQLGLFAALGPDMGAHAFNDLTGRADVSDAEAARRLGLGHSAVSKVLIRVRRNLGMPPRVPNNARHGRKDRK